MSRCPAPVSVVVPVHEVSGHVAGCLASVAAQRLPAAEVILVDDRGRDRSLAVAERAAAAHGLPYRVIAHDRNRGAGAARNTGLAAATGEWVWFLDGDDRAEPDFLATLLAAATRHGADLAVCRTQRVDEAGRRLGVQEPARRRPVVPGPVAARLLLRGELRAYACNKLLRRRALPSPLFDADRSYEDFRPMLRLLLGTAAVALVDAPLYRYTQRPGSVSGRFGPHTMQLLDVAEDVRAELVRWGLHRDWRDAYLDHLYAGAVLPLANMALRAEHAGRRGADTRRAVRAARRRTQPGDLIRLAATGRLRTAGAAALLKAAPGLYSRGLAHR